MDTFVSYMINIVAYSNMSRGSFDRIPLLTPRSPQNLANASSEGAEPQHSRVSLEPVPRDEPSVKRTLDSSNNDIGDQSSELGSHVLGPWRGKAATT